MQRLSLLVTISALTLSLCCCTIQLSDAPSDGLAKTPPMGWNSWNQFKDTIDDKTVRSIADAMVSNGMRDAGYIYVNIDDTWQGARDAQGNLSGNQRFPDMKSLADYIHSKGLKFGIYSSPGPLTCAGYPGSYGHETQDAATFASWGVDYLKYDWCTAGQVYSGPDRFQWAYIKMARALQATGRPIVFSICNYGSGEVQHWAAGAGANLWRTSNDIEDNWQSMISNIEGQTGAATYAGPGTWNDPDVLEIGNGGMTPDEYRTHMSLWALSAAPLLAGNDLRAMSETTESILLNTEVVAIDQDVLGIQATPMQQGDLQTWIKPLADGSLAVGVVNLSSASEPATVNAADLGLADPPASARDVWAHANIQFSGGRYTVQLPPHGVLLLRVSAQE
jgi:alpha-galactosidase